MSRTALKIENVSRLAIAVTWNPRGELISIERCLHLMHAVYESVPISFPPEADPSISGFSQAEEIVRTAIQTYDHSLGQREVK